MSLLEVYIGKSKYTIETTEGEKEKITSLAEKVNERVNKLSLEMRGADEKTILMLCLIMTEEELQSIKNFRVHQESINKVIEEKPKADNSHQEDNIEEVIFNRIENLANKIKNG